MIACTNSNLPMIELLIKANANINRENMKGMTPLHAACLAGNTKAVDLLLDHGADFYKKDKNNLLPIHYAVIKDQHKLLKYLQCDRHFSLL